jgi:pimeloyl-ACP methyl ester carboxylesterase
MMLVFFSLQANLRESQTRAEAAPATGRFVQAGDVELFIQELGPKDSPAVLFIHGAGAWGGIWQETMTMLAQAGYYCIAVDVPPFGFSERPNPPTYSRLDQARRFSALIDALNLSSVTLVGHSFGGGATVETALLVPEKVRALVLVDVALGLQQAAGEPPFLLNAFLATRPVRNAVLAATATNPPLLQMMIADPTDATDAQIAMLQKQLVLQDSTSALGDWAQAVFTAQETLHSTQLTSYAALTMPILIVWGEADTITPLAQGQHLHGLLPNSELVVLQQVNHIPQIEDVPVFNEAVLAFLAKQQ